MFMRTIRVGQFLGRGATKRVVARLRDGRLVAVASSDHDLTREALVMLALAQAPHPHVLTVIALEYSAKRELRLVLPLAPFGNILELADTLEEDGLELTMAAAATALMQITSALRHLCKIGVRHNDVSARNVLVREYQPGDDTKLVCALADFSEAEFCDANEPLPVELVHLAREIFGLCAAKNTPDVPR
jgi:hypothetical protein